MKTLSAVSKESTSRMPVEGFYEVGPQLAAFWLSNFGYQHQRPIRSYHVTSLAAEMVASRFRQRTQVNFCFLDGRYHLTNGQHTLSAIVKSGITQTLCVVVLQVSTEREIADDFSRHDTHLTRRLGDSLVAHEVHKDFGCSLTDLNLISAGSAYYAYATKEINNRSSLTLTHDQKLAIILRHRDLSMAALRIIADHKNKGFLTRKTTFASIMFCLSGQREMAEEFWSVLVADDGLRRGDPRKTLLDWLREVTTIGGSTGARSATRALPDHVLVKGIAAAWNAFANRRDLVLIRPKTEGGEATFDMVGTLRV